MKPLLNRDFKLPTDGWHQLVPVGQHPHPSGLVQVVDATAVQTMCNRFSKASHADNFPGLLVDFDHFSNDTSKPSEAAGWVTEVENRADGLWGKIRWSDIGEAAVKGGRYRLVSPVWNRSDCEPIKGNQVRPLRLDRIALTNDPNIKGMVPLTNRAEDFGANKQRNINMERVNKCLGLAAEASEDAVLAAVTQLQNRANNAENALTPLKNRVGELEKANKSLLEDQIEADLERFKNRISPESRDSWKEMLLSNRCTAVKALEGLAEVKSGTGENKPMHNRATATPPQVGTADGTKTHEEERARKISNRAHQIATQEKIPFNLAWSRADGEFKAS